MRLPTAILAALAALIVPASAGASADPADQPPFGGDPVPQLRDAPQTAQPPPGFELSARGAIVIARTSPVVESELGESPAAEPRALLRGSDWQVSWFQPDGTEVAQVLIDDASARILEAWRDHQVEVKLARGYEDAVGGDVSEWYVWIPLCLLFLAPFIDLRRLGRIVHLDLVVLLGFSLSSFFFNKGEITTSVPLVYPVLAYVFLRLLWIGTRGASPRVGSLLPHVPVRWLGAGLVVLLGARIALNVVDSSVIDIGIAGVVGADRISSGEEIYDGVFAPGIDLRGDVYGPVNYLTYVPFELVFPWSGVWDEVPAAHAAAITFDLAVVVALFFLGRRLRPGAGGNELGLALAWGWAAFPYTTYALASNTNDALVAALVVATMLVLHRPLARGAVLALGAAAKFGPLALAPLFAAGRGERRWRELAPFAVAFVAVWAIVLVPLLPDGGPREFYDRTFGYQASRGSPFSVWGLAPSLAWLQDATRLAAVLFGAALLFWPARRDAVQIAALAGCALILTQAGSQHWFYFFILWWLPLALVAMLSGRSSSEAHRAAAS